MFLWRLAVIPRLLFPAVSSKLRGIFHMDDQYCADRINAPIKIVQSGGSTLIFLEYNCRKWSVFRC